MNKQRLIVSMKKLSAELQDAILQAYPDGLDNIIKKYPKNGTDFFYAFPFETDTISYLIKVDVMVDGQIDENALDSFLDNEPSEKNSKAMFDSELSTDDDDDDDDSYGDDDDDDDDDED